MFCSRLLGTARRKVVALGAALVLTGGGLAACGVANAAGPVPAPKVHSGTFTCTTNASGFCTFTHFLGELPDGITLTLGSPASGQSQLPYQLAVTAKTATTVTIRALNSSGSVYANQALTVNATFVGEGDAGPTTPPPTTPPPTTPPPTTPPPGGPNAAVGIHFTSHAPVEPDGLIAAGSTMATNLHDSATLCDESAFNFGGRIGERRDASIPTDAAHPTAADKWSRTYDWSDLRIQGCANSNIPHKYLTLYAAPVSITGLADFDYGVAAPQPGNRAALARWAVEVMKHYIPLGVTRFPFYNELKGYGSFQQYLDDYNAIWDAKMADPATDTEAQLGGPYEIFSQRQDCSSWGQGSSEISGAWGCVAPNVVNDYASFLLNAHGYNFLAIDLSKGDQRGDTTGNYNPGGLSDAVMNGYWPAVAGYLDSHMPAGKDVVAVEMYGWDGNNAQQFQDSIMAWANGFPADGSGNRRQTDCLIWNESTSIAGLFVNGDGSLATIGTRAKAMRAAGLIKAS